MKRVIWALVFVFLAFFLWRSTKTMVNVPLHDFDEANRAETALNMKAYKSFFSPLVGSPFEQEKFYEKANKNPLLKVHYHLERPPFYFMSMIASTSILDENEYAFRLPSMVFGLLTLTALALFTFPAVYPVVVLMTSYDWWLSSQSALMDTALTFFLFAGFLALLKYIESKKKYLLWVTGISVGMAILSKGQPAAIFIFPLVYALIAKKITFRDVLAVVLGILITIAPWIVVNAVKFGVGDFMGILLDFARKRSLIADTTQLAPVYWYARWWIESLRFGWLLFIALFIVDLIQGRIGDRKRIILSYLLPSFLLFSVSKNKVWWYVLPLIPVVALYVHESVTAILKNDKNKINNLSIITVLLNLPVFYATSNKLSFALAFVMVLLAVFIFFLKIRFQKIISNMLFVLSIIFALTVFYFRFPVMSPAYPEVKEMGKYYQKLDQPKCLFVHDMPYESVLFYTKSEQVNYLKTNYSPDKKCNNYLITPDKFKDYDLLKSEKRLNLYKIK